MTTRAVEGGMTRWAPLSTASVLFLTTTAATWWLAGDASDVPPGTVADYIVRPLQISPVVENLVGIAATAHVAVAFVTLLLATRRGHLHPDWLTVHLTVLGAGIINGLLWRSMTAATIGANIGAGVCAVFGGPVLVGLLIWALRRSITLLRRRDVTAEPTV